MVEGVKREREKTGGRETGRETEREKKKTKKKKKKDLNHASDFFCHFIQ